MKVEWVAVKDRLPKHNGKYWICYVEHYKNPDVFGPLMKTKSRVREALYDGAQWTETYSQESCLGPHALITPQFWAPYEPPDRPEPPI
jgi:hypothetical protein